MTRKVIHPYHGRRGSPAFRELLAIRPENKSCEKVSFEAKAVVSSLIDVANGQQAKSSARDLKFERVAPFVLDA